MSRKREYDEAVERPNLALVAVFAVIAAGLIFGTPIAAQINGTPPSVTSLGFGGRPINGTPPSVTSIGPFGLVPNPALPSSRPLFTFNPLQPQDGHHHHHNNGLRVWGYGVGYYAVPYGYYDQGDEASDDSSGDQYNGGPTIFDRRGPGNPPSPPQQNYSQRTTAESVTAAPQVQADRAPDQPETVLVFKDGHQMEVENYAIVGNTLYDLTQGRRHKIALSELDLDATTKQNNDRGIDFQLPAGS